MLYVSTMIEIISISTAIYSVHTHIHSSSYQNGLNNGKRDIISSVNVLTLTISVER